MNNESDKTMILAKDLDCRECGDQAVAFWPMVDPDIPHYPYCRACLDKAKISLMERLTSLEKEQ